MSEQHEMMGEREHEPEDLLAPPSDAATDGTHPATEDPDDASLPAPEPEAPKAPADPIRRLVWLGWAAVAVLVVLAVLIVAGMARISNALNRVACVQKAQANYAATAGPRATPYELSLARLAINISLNKCGQ